MENMDEGLFLTMLKQTVERHGCKIVDIDIENKMINLDGPEESVDSCARAIAELIG